MGWVLGLKERDCHIGGGSNRHHHHNYDGYQVQLVAPPRGTVIFCASALRLCPKAERMRPSEKVFQIPQDFRTLGGAESASPHLQVAGLLLHQQTSSSVPFTAEGSGDAYRSGPGHSVCRNCMENYNSDGLTVFTSFLARPSISLSSVTRMAPFSIAVCITMESMPLTDNFSHISAHLSVLLLTNSRK